MSHAREEIKYNDTMHCLFIFAFWLELCLNVFSFFSFHNSVFTHSNERELTITQFHAVNSFWMKNGPEREGDRERTFGNIFIACLVQSMKIIVCIELEQTKVRKIVVDHRSELDLKRKWAGFWLQSCIRYHVLAFFIFQFSCDILRRNKICPKSHTNYNGCSWCCGQGWHSPDDHTHMKIWTHTFRSTFNNAHYNSITRNNYNFSNGQRCTLHNHITCTALHFHHE